MNIIEYFYVQFDNVLKHSPCEYIRLSSGDALKEYDNEGSEVESERQRMKMMRERIY